MITTACPTTCCTGACRQGRDCEASRRATVATLESLTGIRVLRAALHRRRLQREIADEAARVHIECHAMHVSSDWPMPVYDVTRLEDDGITDEDICSARLAGIARSAQYLSLRGALVRPFPEFPQLVAFPEAVR